MSSHSDELVHIIRNDGDIEAFVELYTTRELCRMLEEILGRKLTDKQMKDLFFVIDEEEPTQAMIDCFTEILDSK